MKRVLILLLVVTLTVLPTIGCGATDQQQEDEAPTGNSEELTKVQVLLDWYPNTNHTGIYVAKDKGFYEEEGLEVEIIQPTGGGSAEPIAAGKGDFGISYQEQVTYARTAENPLPIKAIAAIIQHNTSGFASPVEKGIETGKDFEGKKYGGWGSPMEEAMIKAVMEKEDGDFSKVETVNIGELDFFTSVKDHVDFTWIYYGWDGVASELKDYPINFIKLQEVEPDLDFYTPVIIAKEDYIQENPELTKKFLNATRKGYEYAIESPEDAVQSLLKASPEIDKELAVASQKYLAKEYKADVDRWGEMSLDRWENYSNWMLERGLIENELDAKEAFTNEYLPE
ncbi:ABC transporter substrate-binding protein [Clostridiisalibacter paucivorans]|uniref:ABC transporter substrate-binding protein n=1 Tax=Clostridiisalibacter paucivorans TaxID=408753 RepID=UPI00047B7F23|nr:ABC transporter substrate-binding protein [Clostridiisalibacter paucivorans]